MLGLGDGDQHGQEHNLKQQGTQEQVNWAQQYATSKARNANLNIEEIQGTGQLELGGGDQQGQERNLKY